MLLVEHQEEHPACKKRKEAMKQVSLQPFICSECILLIISLLFKYHENVSSNFVSVYLCLSVCVCTKCSGTGFSVCPLVAVAVVNTRLLLTYYLCLQCFDAVGWAARRPSSP